MKNFICFLSVFLLDAVKEKRIIFNGG